MSEETKNKKVKEFIDHELGDSIENMTFGEVAEVVQEKYEVSDEELDQILTVDMALDFEGDPTYIKCECPECKMKVFKNEMAWTRDCHGIIFRKLCQDCYEKAMEEGYDGEYYTEADECIDYDY